jgi:hypothetical protein
VPFLRFSRDRRGYENTFLLRAIRKRGEKERPALLYWFRTPPHVKVGRAAFDEDAIRFLEDQHPDLAFDWPRILEARPVVGESPEPTPPPRRDRRDDSRRPTPRPDERPAQPAPPTPAAIDLPADEIDAADPADTPHPLSDPSVVERLLGAEQLARLRGQYAAVLARLDTRITDPARLEALRAQAEQVNPDGWVTETDVREGLARHDRLCSDILRQLGRRRRRRRGGPGPSPGQTG